MTTKIAREAPQLADMLYKQRTADRILATANYLTHVDGADWFAVAYANNAAAAIATSGLVPRNGWELTVGRTFFGSWYFAVLHRTSSEKDNFLAALDALLDRLRVRNFGLDDSPTGPVWIVEESSNAKTGAVATTYVSQATCHSGCKMKGNGCYAEHGPCGLKTQVVNSSPITDPVEIARIEAALIDQLPATTDLRVHVVGDCPVPESARIVGAAMMRYEVRSSNGSKAWTYTHAWRDIPVADWQGANVLASCETLVHVREAQERGYATAIVRSCHPMDKVYADGGLKFLPCPAETWDIQCINCRLCMRTDALRQQGLTIAFTPHGVGKKAVHRTLHGLKNAKG